MLRNREFKRFAILFTIMAAVFVISGFFINIISGVLAIMFAVASGAAFFLYSKTRYDSIARISDQINVVLHNADRQDIDELDEGELSILYSEIKKMTLRIREQNDALKKEKEYLADSLADIAHQLRTPLTSVNLLLSLAANSTEPNERKAFVREAEEMLLHMEWLLTALLKVSRLDAGVVLFKNESIDLDELVSSVLRPFQISMELHSIDIQIDVPKGIIIHGDFGWLSEAIQNILKNCLEGAGESGTIEITCAENPLYTEICIHDNGPGLEKEDLPRLFDRFYRGKNANAAGYGIGLALCKIIITKQGGTITAKNHPHGGALFSIRFPK